MGLVIFALLVIFFVMAISLIYSLGNKKWLLVLVPLTFSSIYILYTTYQKVISLPIRTEVLPTPFRFLDYVLVYDESGKKEIAIWILSKDEDYPKTYIIEYTPDKHKQVDNARKRTKHNSTVMGVKKSKEEAGNQSIDQGGTMLIEPKPNTNVRK